MALEIEAKLKVDSLESVIEKLNRLGAQFKTVAHQGDIYFDNSLCELVASDCCLRLRSEVDLGEPEKKETVLCYKGAKNEGKYKSREEIETCLESPENLIEILARLGYKKVLTVEKERQLWLLDDCFVCLDSLELIGCFVEIEGPSQESVSNVVKKLQLENIEHETRSYACMIEEKISKDKSL